MLESSTAMMVAPAARGTNHFAGVNSLIVRCGQDSVGMVVAGLLGSNGLPHSGHRGSVRPLRQ